MKSDLHAILFDKKHYRSLRSVNAFLKKHNHKPIKKIHETDNFYRARLIDPKKFDRFFTISPYEGVRYVIGYY